MGKRVNTPRLNVANQIQRISNALDGLLPVIRTIEVCAVCEEPVCIGHFHLRGEPGLKIISEATHAERVVARAKFKIEKSPERHKVRETTRQRRQRNMRIKACRNRHPSKGVIADKFSNMWRRNAANLLAPPVQVI